MRIAVENRRPQKTDLVFVLLFVMLLAFNIWKAPYGEVWIDESSYLAIPYRMVQGDSLIVHEWHMAQMSGFLLYPILKLYLALVQSTDGIYLAFRYIYVALHSLVAVFLYLRLKRIDKPGAAAAALTYELFSFSSLMALCYNSMGIGLMLICCLTMSLGGGKIYEYLISGLCFAGAVLCNPFLLIVYALYCLAVLAVKLLKKEETVAGKILSLKGWVLFSSMCALLAVLFFLRIAVYGGLDNVLEALPYVLQDDLHPQRGPLEWLRGFYGTFYRNNSYFKPVLLGSVALVALIFADRKSTARRPFYLVAASGITALFSLTYVLMYREVNYFMFSINVLGFFAYLLCRDKNRHLFWGLYVPGMLYWACIDMASNLGLSSIGGISAVNMPASLIFIVSVLREMKEESKLRSGGWRIISRAASLVALVTVFVLWGSLFKARAEVATYGFPIYETNTMCNYGAQKGIICTPEQAQKYEDEYFALQDLRRIEEGNVMYFQTNSIRYLEDSKRSSTTDMWFAYSTVEKGLDRLQAYWELFPEKYPDYVYIPQNDRTAAIIGAFDSFEYDLKDLGTGLLLYMK